MLPGRADHVSIVACPESDSPKDTDAELLDSGSRALFAVPFGWAVLRGICRSRREDHT
jgi:hypothetical protein